jgi:hypothetical protein
VALVPADAGCVRPVVKQPDRLTIEGIAIRGSSDPRKTPVGFTFARGNRARWDETQVNFVGFSEGYVAVPDEPSEEDLGRRRWFRHALAWEPPAKVGGLIRAANYDDPLR